MKPSSSSASRHRFTKSLAVGPVALALALMGTRVWAAPPSTPSAQLRAPLSLEMRTEASHELEGPRLPEAPPPNYQVDPKNWNMVVAGDVLIGVGMGAFAVMVAGLAVNFQGREAIDRLSLMDDATEAQRKAAQDKARLGSHLAIGGGVATAVLVGTGITLVAVGNRRERLRRETLDAAVPGRLSLLGSRERVGLQWSLDF